MLYASTNPIPFNWTQSKLNVSYNVMLYGMNLPIHADQFISNTIKGISLQKANDIIKLAKLNGKTPILTCSELEARKYKTVFQSKNFIVSMERNYSNTITPLYKF